MKATGIIFDMDGTLYRFDRGVSASFGESAFSRQIAANTQKFFVAHFGVTPAEAEAHYQDMKTRFAGQVSLGLEREYGIPRETYFAATWDLDPHHFMDRDEALISALSDLTAQRALLTAAPRIWADRVIRHLDVERPFRPHIFTGESDIRKPNPQAFLQIAEAWQLAPGRIVSIGDQEHTDILPAKEAGFMTVLISSTPSSIADFTAVDVPTALELLRKEKLL